jgi:gamma-glutamylcyclotransferase (GGCT)/AIG2-like uncharacterized protein YtfP
MTVRLVVYGLLRRGESLAHLMDGAEFLGDVNVPGFDLYDLGHYPGACPGDGAVVGELYELASPAVLDLLDEAEGVHQKPPLYRRELVDAQGIPAWFYVYARHVAPDKRIDSGDWLDR